MTESNSRQNVGDVERVFRPDAGPPAAAVGYVTEAGEAQAVRGDDAAPYLKTPPFATEIVVWVNNLPIPRQGLEVAEDYFPLNGLDCLQQRLIQVYFDITIASDELGNGLCELSIIPEGLAHDVWHVLGVVDPTVTLFTPTASARFPYALGSRPIAPAELRSPAFSLAAGGAVPFLLTFDIAPYEAFRINVRDLTGDGEEPNLLRVDYAFSQ